MLLINRLYFIAKHEALPYLEAAKEFVFKQYMLFLQQNHRKTI